MDIQHSSSLPEGVLEVVVKQGLVFGRFAPQIDAADVSISVAGHRVGFETCDRTRMTSALPPSIFEPEYTSFTAESISVDGLASVHLNHVDDWRLLEGNTIQIHVFSSERPCRILLPISIAVPATEAELVFRTLLSVHRGSGRLLISATAAPGDAEPQAVHRERITLRDFRVHFDPACLGGHTADGYQSVQFPIPPSEVARIFEFTLEFEEATGPDPWFFIANPTLTEREAAEQTLAERRLLGLGRKENAPWMMARLPCPLEAHDVLTMSVGDHTLELLGASSVDLHVQPVDGHTLRVRTSEDGVYLFVFDGSHEFLWRLRTGETPVRLPASVQNGEVRHLSVYDRTGTQCLFRDYIQTRRILTPLFVLHKESRPPFPTGLMLQSAQRYEALKAHAARGTLTGATAAQLAHAVRTLEGGYANVRLEPLEFPAVDAPTVSIVMPVHNKIEVTYSALCSLLLAHNETTFEVIVVDDGSTDDTLDLAGLVSNITVLRNDVPERFIRACNRGASQARGAFIALLNNDVEVTAGWLDALLAAFRRFDNVGLVGSKLLYPDGRLQDAGGIVWKNGNPWNYGRGQNPWEPRFSYARQVDYLCGAAMMTTRAIWDEVGGLSTSLEPMYFEDTDFAFKVREAGYTTWFVPDSLVYHHEGATSGADIGSGFKVYQEINRPKFKRRWARACASHGIEGQAPDLEKDRGIIGRVLFIDYSIPRADRDAGSWAALQEIRLVQALGYKVTFLPLNIAHLGTYNEELHRSGVETVFAPFVMSTNEFIDRHGPTFDAIYITRYNVAQQVLDQVRRAAPAARVILNLADLHFLRQLRSAIALGDPARAAAAETTRQQELDVIRKVDLVLSYSDTEHAVIESHTLGEVKVRRCPWVAELPEAVPPAADRAGLSFLGNFLHHPNGEGIAWFVREVMGRVATLPDPARTLWIYGANMTDEVRALASEGVRPVGYVADVSTAFDRHRIFVAPLLAGAGIKGKVINALAHGIPTVLSPVAAEGIGLRHGYDCMIARTPADWVEAIEELLASDATWARLSANGRAFVRENFSFETGTDLMRQAFEAVDLFTFRT